MDDILKIKALTFKYTDTIIFKNLDLILKYNEWYTLIGKSGSGKTTLVKIISGLIEDNFNIEFNFLDMNKKNMSEIRTRMSVLFSDIYNQFIEDNVYDEIIFELKNMNLNKDEINEFIKDVNEIIDISNIFEKEMLKLSNYEKCLVLLISALIIKPKLLIIDETFANLTISERKKLYDIIFKYKSKYKLTVLNITNNLEDSLIGDNIIVLNNSTVISNESVKETYEKNILDENNYKLPFIINLSNHLKLYELIDKNSYSIEELVDAIWK